MRVRHRCVGRPLIVSVGVLCGLITTGLAGTFHAVAQLRTQPDLIEMSLEELLALEITSAGKKEQLIGETAAAVYVITADDIRRSQATTVMELLRQVPGVHVARFGTGKWSIGIRGFIQEDANKLLVLMDGRSLYTPIYTGVEWKAQDTLLEDIDRIEVIRGPGASLWGANAVNGVINIITKEAAATQGAAVTYQAGTLDNGTVTARYGGALGETAHYRLFTKYFNRRSLPDANGFTEWGGWNSARQGGRLDWRPTSRDELTLNSEWYLNDIRELDDEVTAETFPLKTIVHERDRTKAGFMLGKWSRSRESGSRFNLQFFYDRSRMYDAGGLDRDESVETTDLEFQYQMNPEGHEIVWGLGFRQVRDKVGDAVDSWFSPDRFTARTYNAFAQDELAWREDSVRLTLGSKFEWNAFSDAEVQPTARLLWAPTITHSVWTAASRAVRVPSRFEVHQFALDDVEEEDGHINYDFVMPPDAFKPEKLTAYETGYRFVPSIRLSVDVALFYNVYDDLQTIEPGEAAEVALPIPGAMRRLTRTNAGFGTVYGAELLAFWTVNEVVQLSGSYTRINMRMDPTGFPHNENGERVEDLYTPNAFFVRAYVDLPYGIESSSELRYVGPVPGQEVPGYVDGNVHLSRGIRSGVRLKLSVDNLFHRNHGEWDEGELVLPRGIRAGIDWRF